MLGTVCAFAHGAEELRERPNLMKTSLCNWYRRGRCDLGESCPFAHGSEELRQPDSVDSNPLYDNSEYQVHAAPSISSNSGCRDSEPLLQCVKFCEACKVPGHRANAIFCAWCGSVLVASGPSQETIVDTSANSDGSPSQLQQQPHVQQHAQHQVQQVLAMEEQRPQRQTGKQDGTVTVGDRSWWPSQQSNLQTLSLPPQAITLSPENLLASTHLMGLDYVLVPVAWVPSMSPQPHCGFSFTTLA